MTKFSDCFWTIMGSDLNNGSLIPDYSFISVTFNNLSNINVYVNNGTNISTLNDKYQYSNQYSSFVGNTLVFSASQAIYIVALAYSS